MFLPRPGGRFPVGATTFKLAVPPCSLSSAKVRPASSELKQCLVLEEVAFTAYYPADVSPKNTPKGFSWLLRPLSVSLHGYSNYSGISVWLLWPLIYLFGALLRIPIHPHAPLLNPHRISQTESSKSSPWQLVIFSHRLGGSRTAYSHLCTRIASSGRVVLAMEHCDGSAHAAIPSSSDPIPYVKESNLVWPPDHPAEKCNMLSFRNEQLEFRKKEIYHALRAIRNLVRDGRGQRSLETTEDVSIDLSGWFGVGSEKPVECEANVVLAGHSFGGATVFSILSDAPPDGELPILVQQTLILDPWLEPLPSPGPLPHHRFKEEHHPSILIINSEGFTLWKDHFQRLMEVGQSWAQGRWEVLTIVGSKHISFSDFPILPCVSSKGARLILDRILHLSLAFLDGKERGATLDSPAKKMKIRVIGKRADGRAKRQLVGDLCDVIVH